MVTEATLRKRERVLEFRRQGLTYVEIGARLGISAQWAADLVNWCAKGGKVGDGDGVRGSADGLRP